MKTEIVKGDMATEWLNGHFLAFKSKIRLCNLALARENSRRLATLLLVSPPNDVWETSAEIPNWWKHHYPDRGSASDWLNQISHVAWNQW